MPGSGFHHCSTFVFSGGAKIGDCSGSSEVIYGGLIQSKRHPTGADSVTLMMLKRSVLRNAIIVGEIAVMKTRLSISRDSSLGRSLHRPIPTKVRK